MELKIGNDELAAELSLDVSIFNVLKDNGFKIEGGINCLRITRTAPSIQMIYDQELDRSVSVPFNPEPQYNRSSLPAVEKSDQVMGLDQKVKIVKTPVETEEDNIVTIPLASGPEKFNLAVDPPSDGLNAFMLMCECGESHNTRAASQAEADKKFMEMCEVYAVHLTPTPSLPVETDDLGAPKFNVPIKDIDKSLNTNVPRGDYSIECRDCEGIHKYTAHKGVRKVRCPRCQTAKSLGKKARKKKQRGTDLNADDPEGWANDDGTFS